MGMTDLQFKAFLKEIVSDLEKALLISPDNEEIKEMLKKHRETLQS